MKVDPANSFQIDINRALPKQSAHSRDTCKWGLAGKYTRCLENVCGQTPFVQENLMRNTVPISSSDLSTVTRTQSYLIVNLCNQTSDDNYTDLTSANIIYQPLPGQ